jgi:hypothetical protein
MSLITERESTKSIPVQIHIVDANNIIGYSVSDTIPCAEDNVIPNNALILYLADIQKSHNAEYSFAISYDEHTKTATEMKSIPMTDTRFSPKMPFKTSLLVIVMRQRSAEKKNIANGTRRIRRNILRARGTRKSGY